MKVALSRARRDGGVGKYSGATWRASAERRCSAAGRARRARTGGWNTLLEFILEGPQGRFGLFYHGFPVRVIQQFFNLGHWLVGVFIRYERRIGRKVLQPGPWIAGVAAARECVEAPHPMQVGLLVRGLRSWRIAARARSPRRGRGGGAPSPSLASHPRSWSAAQTQCAGRRGECARPWASFLAAWRVRIHRCCASGASSLRAPSVAEKVNGLHGSEVDTRRCEDGCLGLRGSSTAARWGRRIVRAREDLGPASSRALRRKNGVPNGTQHRLRVGRRLRRSR